MNDNQETRIIEAIHCLKNFVPSDIIRATALPAAMIEEALPLCANLGYVSVGAMGDREQHYFVSSQQLPKVENRLLELHASQKASHIS
jgi:hypothetical protein